MTEPAEKSSAENASSAIERLPLSRRVMLTYGISAAALGALGSMAWAEPAAAVTASQAQILSRLSMPFSGGISSPYGRRWLVIDGVGRWDQHKGIDFARAYGTPFPAAGAGTVVFNDSSSGLGNQLAIDHGSGILTRYHMLNRRSPAAKGSRVAVGQIVGEAGKSGSQATGPHLHFELHIDGQHVDPLLYIGVKGVVPAPPPTNSEKDDDDMAYAIVQDQDSSVASYQCVGIYGGGIKNGWVEVIPANRGHFNVFQTVTNTQAAQGRGQALPLLSVDPLAWNVIKDLYYKP